MILSFISIPCDGPAPDLLQSHSCHHGYLPELPVTPISECSPPRRHGRLDTDGTPKHGILLFYQDTVNKPLVDYWEINRVYYRLLTVILDRHYWSANLRAGSPAVIGPNKISSIVIGQ